MPVLNDGDTVEVQGSAAKPYVIKNIGGVYSCSCPAWKNQSAPIERRTCKHLRKILGDEAEQRRVGTLPAAPVPKPSKPTPPALLLAHSWDASTDPSGFWLSEKLDGVRAWWDGGGQFLSRQGNRFFAPDWFTKSLPRVPLDGELWMARKAFQRTVSIVRRQDEPAAWRDLQFVVFDAPAASGVFENRLAAATELLAERDCSFARVLNHERCRGEAHLHEELARIVALGGEGLMLREPGSLYETGRSHTLLKCKQFLDAEAIVIGHQPGSGRHKGRLGALLVALADGTEFAVGSGFTDAQREHPPAVGSTITFRYQELTDGGVPRFPVFARARTDTEQVAP